MPTNKALGQHWLTDRSILAAIADEGNLTSEDTVLEVGPGLGTLTSILLRRVKRVVAVEFDENLALKLPGQFPGTSLEVVHDDILHYDLSKLPRDYKVVANVPYYITSKIIEKLLMSDNPPARIVLLIQKEVAERIVASPGNMSILAISVQLFANAHLGEVVEASAFTPPPKVDSQTVVLETRSQPLVASDLQRSFFRVVKAGFMGKRKKLRSSLSAGLSLEKNVIETLLHGLSINPDLRAQDLSIEQWMKLTEAYNKL